MHKQPYVIALTCALIGAPLTGLLSWKFYDIESTAIYNNFKNDVDDKAASIVREIKLNFEVLYNLKVLFDNSKLPVSIEFQRVTKNILDRHNSIQALEWIPRVSNQERESVENARRQEYPEFEITERHKQGLMIRAQNRIEYYPVYYVEPLAGNEAAFGFDLASNPSRLETLKLSRDTGKILATASITLVQETSNQKGFLTFLPIYHGQSNTVAERRDNISGFILGVYRIGDIFNRSILHTSAVGINMFLHDETVSVIDNILHIHRSSVDEILQTDFEYHKQLPEFAGRTWSIVATPTIGYISKRRSILPYVIFGSGLIIVIFVSIYLYLISQRSIVVKQLVQEKTKELSEANEKLRQISLTDGLTGIANRRSYDNYLEKEWMRSIRDKTPITIIMIDVDNFKLFNDHYGHYAGDKCLKNVAHTLSSLFRRPADLVARYGGEEFSIILPNTDNAFEIANNCRAAIEDLHILHEHSNVSNEVTISVGISSAIPSGIMDPYELVNYADKALYRAKESGRNRVEKI